MALTDKLTAVADAIRAKTGSSASLTLSQMVTEISDIQTGITPSGSLSIAANGTYDVTDKAQAVVAVPTGSTHSQCWKLTLAEDTATAAAVQIAISDWLQSVRNDASLVISLVPLFAPTAATVRVVTATQTNHALNGTSCGYAMRYNVAGSSVTNAAYNHQINATATYPQGFKISESGALIYYCRDGGTSHALAAGDYLITASVEP